MPRVLGILIRLPSLSRLMRVRLRGSGPWCVRQGEIKPRSWQTMAVEPAGLCRLKWVVMSSQLERGALAGVFPVLQSPFDNQDRLDCAVLSCEVEFCIRAGVHGVVYPAIASEFQYLTDDERRAGVRAVIEAAAGRIPVVAGVAGASGAQASVYAEDAREAGASAVMALPPYISPGRVSELRQYYARVAAASSKPLFVQHSQPGMDVEFLADLVSDIENVQYIKEEMHPSAHFITGVLDAMSGGSTGVFGGYYGRWMLSELERGATGFMPSAESVDVHVQVWDAWQRDDRVAAREIFNCLLPLINQSVLLETPLLKEVLVRRGVFSSARMRQPGALELDASDLMELDVIMDALRPFFRA